MAFLNGRTLAAAVACIGGASAWGPDGHTIIAHIADYYLSPDVKAVLNTDLMNVSLNNASDWNDDFDHSPEGRWSAPLHFVNYPGKACKFDWATDCKNDWCAAGSIVNYTRQVFDPKLSEADRFFALKFVIHMVGDIHQPLHVSSGDNYGGNAIKLPPPHFSAKSKSKYPTNLHACWDSVMLLTYITELEDKVPPPAALTSPSESWPVHYHNWSLVADMLEKKMDGEWSANKTAWQSTVAGGLDRATLVKGISGVAEETAERGCTYAYNYADGSAVKSGDLLEEDYAVRAQPIIFEQLAKGGVRLAQLLEEALKHNKVEARAELVI